MSERSRPRLAARANAGLSWPLPDNLDEAALAALFFKEAPSSTACPLPDFCKLHAELSRPGVTRMLLWQEYKTAHPEGWQYSVFCDRYRRWLATQDPVLWFEHAPGEKLFVDYAGQTIPVVDRYTGELKTIDGCTIKFGKPQPKEYGFSPRPFIFSVTQCTKGVSLDRCTISGKIAH